MGELIYCKNSIAKTPYYIEDAGLNIYSLEELSYYIYHNPFLIDKALMSDEFILWMQQELKETEAAKQLTELKDGNSPLHLFVGRVLNTCGYLSRSEIRQTMELIAEIENKSESECKKIRGDRFMDKGKIVDAIYEYENIINNGDDSRDEFIGDIYHNLGCAYARLFFFDQSISYFDRAYEKNKRQESLKSLFYALRCNRNESQFDSYVTKYHLSEEVAEKIKEEVTVVSTCDEIKAFGKELDELYGNSSSESQLDAQFEKLIGTIQTGYNEMSKTSM